ncbi:hypothetical protein [Desulfococcus sp.]
MDIKKPPPWNCFKKKDENAGSIVPVHHSRRCNPGRRHAAEKF